MNDINIAKEAILQINDSDYEHVSELNDWVMKYDGIDNFIDKCCIGVNGKTVCLRFPEMEWLGKVRRIAFDVK